ncbi:MAG: hypothetical protein AAF950_14615 [Pseudomonadota bacterium]
MKKVLKCFAITITSAAATINCFAGMTFAWDFTEKRISGRAYADSSATLDDVPTVRCIADEDVFAIIE